MTLSCLVGSRGKYGLIKLRCVLQAVKYGHIYQSTKSQIVFVFSLCFFFSPTLLGSKNISLGFSWSKNNSCSLPNLISSDKLYLAIFLEGSDDPLKTLQHVTAFAPKPSVSLCRFGDTGKFSNDIIHSR